jgi:hypothetical protein
MVSPKVVRSLGWDPGYHEELRNGPEIKIHIREVGFRVFGKFRNFPAEYRKVLERSGRGVPRWGPPALEGPRGREWIYLSV